ARSPSNAPSRVVVSKPHEALLSLLPSFYPAVVRERAIHPTVTLGRCARLGKNVSLDEHVTVGAGVTIGDGVWIGAHAVIGDGVTIGAESRVFPNVTVYSGTEIGERVRVHGGAVVGSDGFGYISRPGEHALIPHVGRCIVGDDVDIGANTTIDRGSIDNTVIGAGTKIDNLVQIGHNVRVGKLCLIIAQAGGAGSGRSEDGCVIAGQVGISGHHTVGKGATLAAQAGVFSDIPAGETWSGYPARPHKEALRAQAALFKLPNLLRRIERLLNSTPEPK